MFNTRGDIPENGFNRYMVECELFRNIALLCMINVLIDTWWNVNLVSIMAQLLHSQF